MIQSVKNNVAIGIRGCIKDPWTQNWQECLATWAGKMITDGWRIKVHIGHPELTDDYIDLQNFFVCKTTDNMGGVFMKSVYYPSKWLLEQDKYTHIFVTDSDSFIHPQRFENEILKLQKIYGELDYVGALIPIYDIDIEKDFSIKKIPNDSSNSKYTYASGGSGFLLSKKLAERVVLEIDNRAYLQYKDFKDDWFYYDDYFLGKIVEKYSIPSIHSNAFQSTSHQRNEILDCEPPPIESKRGSFVCVQHYRAGDMKDIMKSLKLT